MTGATATGPRPRAAGHGWQVPADAKDRLIACLVSVIVLALTARVLMLHRPVVRAEASESTLQIRFIARATVIRTPHTSARPFLPDQDEQGLPSALRRTASPATASVRIHADQGVPLVLYGRDGRLLLPEDAAGRAVPVRPPPGTGEGVARNKAPGPFDRRNPVDYRETRFDKAWLGKGTAGDSLLENAHGTVTGTVVIPLGTRDQPARARPPPEVRFNPAYHERVADLGSEATGDAYKAAPIASEPAPGLEGAASRAIREQLAALGADFPHCRKSLYVELLRPIQQHLSQLERVEHAFANGADPTRAEHLLPREADMAYNLARRAAWHARATLSSCPR